MYPTARILAVGLLLAAVAPLAAKAADDDKKLGWKSSAELSYVLTAGNSKSTTLGFKDETRRNWVDALLTIKAGAVRAETTDYIPVVSGNAVVIDEQSRLAAENYYLNGTYDRKITDTFYWTVGAGWERNRFAGFDSRWLAMGGVGNIWSNTEEFKWKTSYGITYTTQDDTNGDSESFAGGRATSELRYKFSPVATFENVTLFDLNFKSTEKWRGDMTNSIAVAMNKTLALKAALQWQYQNHPPSKTYTLPDPPGGTYTTDLEKLDTIFTTSLVINF